MKKIPLFLLMFSLALISWQDGGQLFRGALCVEHVTTIDAKNGLHPDMTIVIKNGKIKRVVPSKDLKLSRANQIIDGTGKFIIPGLWDAHVHLGYFEDLAPSMFHLFLTHGVTSIRDNGGQIDFVKKWKEAAMKHPTDAPRVMIAGPLIDGLPNVYDGSSPSHPPISVGNGSVADAIRLVDQLDSIGVDFLKAYEMLNPEQFLAIAKRAKEKGLKVSGHIPLSMDAISASNAGLSSMEHLRNLEMSIAHDAEELLQNRQKMLAAGNMEPGHILRSKIHIAQRMDAIKNSDPQKVTEVLGVLAKNQTWQIPTLVLARFNGYRLFSAPEWQETFKYIPAKLEEQWSSNIKNIQSQDPNISVQQYSNWMLEILGKIHEAGIGIMAGTDCPIFYLTPGPSLHQELVLLVKAGLSPLEAIGAATVMPARYFKMEDELGLIEQGMWADLVLLDANPLVDISNTQKINAVIKQGKWYSRKKLDEMLEALDRQ